MSYHQNEDILTSIKNYTSCEYQTLNRKDWVHFFYDDVPENLPGNPKGNWNLVKEHYNYLNLNLIKPSKLTCTAGGQFIVNKESILRNSLETYKNLLNWLESTSLGSDMSGRVFEHLWHYIFTHKEIEIHC
jgi:hypothetical protein